MKKILACLVCLSLATTALVACSSDKSEDTQKTNEEQKNVSAVVDVVNEEENKFEIPEEEKDFTVEVDNDVYSAQTTLKITSYEGDAEELVIPTQLTHEEYGVCDVTSIGAVAFLGNESLTKVTIPEGIVQIGTGAFQNCKNLKDVVIYDGEALEDGTEKTATLTTIGENAFYNSGLTNINIPSTVTSIGNHAFSSQLVQTPWYASLKGDLCYVGDDILIKCNIKNLVSDTAQAVATETETASETSSDEGENATAEADSTTNEESADESSDSTEGTENTTEQESESTQEPTVKTDDINYVEVDVTRAKHISYDAFSSVGALKIKLGTALESLDRNAVFEKAGTTTKVKFLVPYEEVTAEKLTTTESLVRATGVQEGEYEVYGAPEKVEPSDDNVEEENNAGTTEENKSTTSNKSESGSSETQKTSSSQTSAEDEVEYEYYIPWFVWVIIAVVVIAAAAVIYVFVINKK